LNLVILNLVNEHGQRMTLEKSARLFFGLFSFGRKVEGDKPCFWNRSRKSEVLPVCLAPDFLPSADGE
jgi:hypothetical protein